MRVDAVQTENFRLLQSGRCEFSPGVNVIAGANAQGKTTLLEAVYLLTGAKSFRTYYDKELIAFEKDEAAVRGEYFASEREQRMEILLRRGRTRTMKRNGVKLSAGETEQCLKAILFSPDDLAMIRGAAALRRRMLDAAITQLRPGYGALIAEYRRLQENKTRILRDWREKPSLLDTLDVFSDGMCLCSAKIIRYRASFARRLSETAQSVQSEFSRGAEKLTLTYTTVSTVADPAAGEREIYEAVSERQRQLRGAELDSGLCLVGAHKDDLQIAINGADARSYASQGQTRTAALSLKLAEREIFLAETGETPVLLDLGVETYCKKTFSPQRYEIWTMQSSWHNLPEFDGCQQQPGAAFAARDVQCLPDGLTLDLAPAYGPVPGLGYYRRTALLSEKGLVFTDETDYPRPVALTLLSLTPLTDARFEGADRVETETVPIKDARLRQAWPGTVTRTRVWFTGRLRAEVR